MKFLIQHIIVVVSILLLNAYGFAQQLNPPIHNYTSIEYKAASQNWDIDTDANGIIYVANNEGLLSFDGQAWELFPLPNGGIVRSVFVQDDKIFTGSYKEFGYWEKDVTGQLFYTSLIPKLKKNTMQSEEIWEILSFQGAIYFRSFGAIYKYKENKVVSLQNVISNKMIVYRDKLVLAIRKEGLFYLDAAGELKPMPNQQQLKDRLIVDMAVNGDKLLVGTREELYEYDENSSRLYRDQKLLAEIKRSELNHLMLTNNHILIGTVKNGIVDYNRETKTYTVLNRNNGLQNNTVLGFVKKHGNLWLSLDNGIDRVDLDSPIRFYTDDTGELGAVYDLEFKDGKLFLGSNTGVYTFEDDQLKIIEGAEGHTWNLKVLQNTLYVSHNTGTYRIVNDALVPIENSTGSFNIDPIPGPSSEYFISTYTGLRNYNLVEDKLYRLDSVDFPVRNIAFEEENTLWAVHPYEGIYRIGLAPDFKSTNFIKKIELPTGGNSINTNIFKINNQLAIYNGDRWLKYNSFNDSIEAFDELAAYRGHKLLLRDGDSYWFNNTHKSSLAFTDFGENNIIVASKKLNNRLVKNYEQIIKNGDSVYYIALKDGFASIDLKRLIKDIDGVTISKPLVKGFLDTEKRYNLNQKPEIPYKNSRNINIVTAFPVSDAISLRYRLRGEDTLSGEVEKGVINLQNLDNGEYDLKLYALGPQENIVEENTFSFIISPPWYLSRLMKIFYLLLFLGLAFFIYWFNQLKLKKQQLLLEQKFEKEHQERLNKLEKERLLNEITLKRKELANTTMVAAKKNEMLMEIQNELNKDKSNFSNQFRIKHIMNKINRAIKNKDEWKVFETNFNELHADFFKVILEKYPNLSSKDLKLCSYLKMNLTSKEIAPLMGISVRGVEVHRYRLRKKMELDKKENLTNFLIKEF
jgi:DNA-binding CsgD family transcriptional regulator